MLKCHTYCHILFISTFQITSLSLKTPFSIVHLSSLSLCLSVSLSLNQITFFFTFFVQSIEMQNNKKFTCTMPHSTKSCLCPWTGARSTPKTRAGIVTYSKPHLVSNFARSVCRTLVPR